MEIIHCKMGAWPPYARNGADGHGQAFNPMGNGIAGFR